MSSDPPNQEWTVFMFIDNQPAENKRKLVFSLSIEAGGVSGDVSINTLDNQKVHLSSVTGQSRELIETRTSEEQIVPTLLTVSFTWGARTIVLAGNTFRDEELNKFNGRFFAFNAPVIEPPGGGGGGIPEPPGEGETGTGTGTQT